MFLYDNKLQSIYCFTYYFIFKVLKQTKKKAVNVYRKCLRVSSAGQRLAATIRNFQLLIKLIYTASSFCK